MYFFTIVPVAPLREGPSHRSEMVSQLLMGEYGELMEEQKDFIKVRCLYDGYEGWVQSSQVMADTRVRTAAGYTRRFTETIHVNKTSVKIPLAAPVYAEAVEFNHLRIEYPGSVIQSSLPTADAHSLISLAKQYLGTAYLWGGKSPLGVDCSGFVQQVYKLAGIQLPRDAWQQAAEGTLVDFVQEVQPGDLAFFDNEDGRIIHVGLMLSPDKIIHASGDVHIDPMDGHGIIHHIRGERTHKLRVIKRLLHS